MYRIVYCSQARQPFNTEQLEQLLTVARVSNANQGITGMLLYRNGRFIQALEGLEPAVMSTFDRILHDTRHHNISLLHQQDVDKRLFAEWSMGFAVPRGQRVATLPGYAHFLTEAYDPRLLLYDPTIAMSLLTAFRDHACAA